MRAGVLVPRQIPHPQAEGSGWTLVLIRLWAPLARGSLLLIKAPPVPPPALSASRQISLKCKLSELLRPDARIQARGRATPES